MDYVFLKRGRATPVFDAGRQIQWSAERLNRSGRTVFRGTSFSGNLGVNVRKTTIMFSGSVGFYIGGESDIRCAV